MGSASRQIANVVFDISGRSLTLISLWPTHTENGQLLCWKRFFYSHCYGLRRQGHCPFDSGFQMGYLRPKVKDPNG